MLVHWVKLFMTPGPLSQWSQLIEIQTGDGHRSVSWLVLLRMRLWISDHPTQWGYIYIFFLLFILLCLSGNWFEIKIIIFFWVLNISWVFVRYAVFKLDQTAGTDPACLWHRGTERFLSAAPKQRSRHPTALEFPMTGTLRAREAMTTAPKLRLLTTVAKWNQCLVKLVLQ